MDNIPTFSDLVQICGKLFSKNNFIVKYMDDDEDMVTMSSDIEFQEALNVLKQQQSNILKLFLFVEEEKGSAKVESQSQRTTASPQAPSSQQTPSQVPASPQAPSSQQAPAASPEQSSFDLSSLLSNSPLGQFIMNPQVLRTLLSNPPLMAKISQFFQNFQPQNVANPIADISSLFQNLGLNPQQTPAQGQDPASYQQGIEQLFANLTQMMGNLSSNLPKFPPTSSPAPCKSDEEQPLHSGVVCDGCGTEAFTGTRYKCTVCSDFDLCEGCMNKKVHDPSHHLLRISKPVNYGRGCPYFRPGCSARPYKPPMCSAFKDSRLLARFVEDITVPDGTISPPSIKFVKIWRIRNEGVSNWPENTRLSFVGGDRLSNQESVAVPAAAPQQEVDVAVDMVTPSNPGRYVSYWRLSQPDGIRFGQRVWVDMLVVQSDKSDTTGSKATSVEVQATPVLAPVHTQTMEIDVPKKVDLPKEIEIQKEEVPAPSPAVQQILDMGFGNRDQVEQLLAKNNNDVLRTIQDLLNGK